MENKAVKILLSLLLILVGVVSATFLGDLTTSPEMYGRTIESLDENSETVLELVAASTLVSAVVSAIPDDTATPIAEKIADFSEYFLLVLCVLFAEKYLLTIIGAATFRILIPLACVLAIISLFTHGTKARHIALRITIIGLSLFAITPLSVYVSDSIYDTYHSSIEEIIGSAEELANETTDLETITENSSDWGNLLNGGITEFFVKLRDKASRLLNNFVEALAVIIVASCIIPLLSMLFLLWLVKTLTGVDTLVVPSFRKGKHPLPLAAVTSSSSSPAVLYQDDSEDSNEPME